ncbi:hypothetical protein AMATHDRAFT_6991 [Amanita thiersii Skay4041]|uniref:Uncharacterized protein n=1 Tax=Amanita thiersii Skay4041 TaxID=703135 RepID=A0A2A9N9G6_9AGAR|nr:hypothetical protein AMATHDRAFT_6991 [Amanita thiersii Skay4041]
MWGGYSGYGGYGGHGGYSGHGGPTGYSASYANYNSYVNGPPAPQIQWHTASAAACSFVNSGKDKVDPTKLKLYHSPVKSNAAYGKPIGVGLQIDGGVVMPLIRMELDATQQRGIHFVAFQLSDWSKKVEAVIYPTDQITSPPGRELLYLSILKTFENATAEQLWDHWTTGNPVK